MVLPKVLARVIRHEFSCEPDHFHVAVGFPFQSTAGSDAVEIAIDVEFEKNVGAIRRASSLLRHGMLETECFHIQILCEGIDEAGGVVFADVFI